MAAESERQEAFAELMSGHQHRILGYLFALLHNLADAEDVMQQASIIIWQKFDEFEEGTDFFRWSVKIARYEALNFIKYRRRSQLYFSEELMETLAIEKAAETDKEDTARLMALKSCVKKLVERDRNLLENRYASKLTVKTIAELTGRSQSSVFNSLRRIRTTLLECIRRMVAQMEHV